MNKKFMNALLFSAALLSSGVIATSCKDYDDDIDELRNQDQAVKDDLNQKLDAVNSTISSLTSAQDGLKSDIAAAEKAAQDAQAAADEAAKAAADAEAAALKGIEDAAKTAADNLAAAKQELEEAIQKGDNATKEEIDVINKDLETIKGNITALLAFQGTTENTLNALKEADSKLNETVSGLTDTVNELAKIVGNAEAGLVSQVAALEEYQKTNDAAVEGIQEELAGLKAQVDKWKGLDPEQLEAMDAEIKAAQEDITELNGKIATINENLATLYIAVYKGITHIEIVDNMQNAESGKTYAGKELTLLSDIAKRTYTFGTKGEKHNELNPKEKMENAQDFVEGERRRLSETLLVRVTPADASLSASEISLVDTKGTDLIKEGYVQVTGVKKFEGTGVTRAAQNENGLYEITIEVGAKADDTSFDFEKSFKELTTMNDHDVLFALGVNQSYNALAGTTTEAGVRKVTTSYELTFSEARKGEVPEIGFDVYETANKEITKVNVDDLYNRWNGQTGKDDHDVYEYEWADDVEAAPLWQYVNSSYNAEVTSQDARNRKSYFPIAQDTEFTIELDNTTKEAKYFYVTLDRDFASDSEDSELASWDKAYTYSGDIDKVLDIDECGGKATISINLGDFDNDIIGFRVYAVNADGTYVDPDGKAFYVQVGKAAVSLPAVQTPVVVNPYDSQYGLYSDFILVNGIPSTIINAANIESYDIDSKMTEPIYQEGDGTLGALDWWKSNNIFTVHYYDANKQELTWSDLNTGDGWKDVKYIRTEFKASAEQLVDDHVYTGTITVKGDGGRVLATIPVEAQKKLPQTAPEGFGAKANQIVGGLHINYLDPINNGAEGQNDLTRVFNGLNSTDEGAAHYIITFENALRVNGEPEDLVVTGTTGFGSYGDYKFEVAREFIDNTVKHPTKVEFDYGDISFTYNEVQDKCVASNHTVTAMEFETIFSCIYDSEIMTWDWNLASGADEVALTYGVQYGNATTSNLTTGKIKSSNSFNDTDFGKTLKEFLEASNKELGSADGVMNGNYKSIALYTNDASGELLESKKNEYFKPEITNGNIYFTPTKNNEYDNPTGDVASTLHIVYVDIFGHDVVIDLPVTVERR